MKMTILLLGMILSGSFVIAQSNQNGRLSTSTPQISVVNNQPKVHAPQRIIETEENGSKQHYIEDLFVTGKLGVGADITDGEVVDYITMINKANNVGILFDDSSTTGAFPYNDWAIRINDHVNGGDSYFAIEDYTASVRPFIIMDSANANSFVISKNNMIGIGTANPSMNIEIVKGDTPGIRLNQDWSGGWGVQEWDIAGNETNFFIKDVTGGNQYSFRIQPGAPTNTLTLREEGYVGIGTWAPTTQLEVIGHIRTDSTILFNTLTEVPSEDEGRVYMDGNEHLLKVYNGTEWVSIDDSQDLIDANLTGTILQIDIENGASVSVDLQPLVQDLEDRVAALETLVSGKESVKYSSVRLFQNAPNPYKNSTTINYYIPETVENAVLKITAVDGTAVKDIIIYERGEGNVVLDGIDTAKGTYFYSLIIDGRKSETKTLVKID